MKVSVVIPVLNERETLPVTIAALRACRGGHEQNIRIVLHSISSHLKDSMCGIISTQAGAHPFRFFFLPRYAVGAPAP
jgi:hypothetical protein